MIDLVISGIRGRMGQSLARLVAASDDLRIIAGIGRAPAEGGEAEAFGCPVIMNVVDAGPIISEADVVLDFSTPEATRDLLQHANMALERRALVVGTTGLDEDTHAELATMSHLSAVLTSANFSVGVSVLLALLERVAGALDAAQFDVEIIETHHGGKIDAPSGTALAFGHAITAARHVALESVRRDGRGGRAGKRPQGEIGFHAVRGGGAVGEHRVLFLGAHERIELVHEATDRAIFAEGALRATRWLAERAPGRYSMADVLGMRD